MDKVALLFDQVIIYSLMTNKKRNISSSKCPMDIKLDEVVAFNMRPTPNKSNQISIHEFFSTSDLYL